MPLKQMFLVNTDLKMGCGKMCAQVAHAEVLYMENVMIDYADIEKPDSVFYSQYEQWKDSSVKPIGTMKKVVLKATEQQMHDISYILYKENINYYRVWDLGNTQVKKGSFTCFCTEPVEEKIADEIFGHLKLL